MLGLLLAPDADPPNTDPDPDPQAEPAPELTDAAPASDRIGDPNTPWIRRWRPQRNTLHQGLFAGVLLPADNIELFETDFGLPDQGFKPYGALAPEFGARLGYFPLRALGVEAEGAFGLGRLEDDTQVNLWSVRGHLIAQVPRWSVTPFILGGAGVLGVSSDRNAVGSDLDPAIHVGGGVAFHISRGFMLRLDARDVITPKQGSEGGATNNPEFLLGFTWTRRPRALEVRDDAPIVIETAAPPLAVDTDGDGFLDDQDACVTEPGVAPEGCPVVDPDGDGILAPDDACPEEAGPAPTGCPLADTDGDGLLDPDDRCPNEPETYNEFEDGDGCPDALPSDLGAFTGTLEGVNFQINRAQLRGSSKQKLDDVAAILMKYPGTKVEISGHTDSTGPAERNQELSQQRADAVKAYLVEQGVGADRIRTRGAGPDEPIDTNKSPEGRARNRRIEFRLLD
ncbi:MAG: OmpA family protein [Myxococcota bacterium]